MPYISVVEPCYNQLTEMKNALIAEKKSRNEPTRTTYSEIICSLIRFKLQNSNDPAKMPTSNEPEMAHTQGGNIYKASLFPPQELSLEEK